MKKVLVAIFLACSIIPVSAACGKPSESAPSSAVSSEQPAAKNITLSLAYSSAVGTTNDVCMNYAANLVSEKSNGTITIQTYPAGQMGADKEVLEECINNNVSMMSASTAAYVGTIPQLAVFDLPCAYQDLATGQELVSDSAYFEEISGWYAQKGLKLLLIEPVGFRYLTTKKTQISSFADFKGLNIRTMENNNHMAFWKQLGANPTPLASNEVYLGLQQGLVEAQEGALTGIVNGKYYEQQKEVIKTSHLAQVFAVSINMDLWNRLDAATQTLLLDSFKETQQYMRNYCAEADAKDLQTCIDAGMQYSEVDAATFAEMKEASKAVYDNIASDIGQDAVDRFLTQVAEFDKK